MKKSDKKDVVVIVLSIGIALSFFMFLYCVFIYIYNSNRINTTVTESMMNLQNITQETLDTYEELQSFYKDSTNFNIISLLYVLISSVFMGTLGLYVQRQKERLDKFEEKKDHYSNEILKHSKSLVFNSKKIKSHEESLKKNYLTIKKLSDNVNVLSQDVTTIKSSISDSEKEQDFILIMQTVSIAMHYATNINSICVYEEANSIVMSEYATRFRDTMNNLINYYNDQFEKLSKKHIDIIRTQIFSIFDILRFANDKNMNIYDEDTHEEFSNYCKILIKKLESLEADIIDSEKTSIVIKKTV